MEKPLLIVETEFQQELTALVNKYIPQVPARYLRFDVEDLLRQLADLEQQQFKEIKANYEKEVETDG